VSSAQKTLFGTPGVKLTARRKPDDANKLKSKLKATSPEPKAMSAQTTAVKELPTSSFVKQSSKTPKF
jgi:hypothetical protein